MSENPEEDRQLLHDAGWKKIQQNTFTRWVNQHLAAVGMSIDNLETDLGDGIKLIKLVEVLAGQPITQRYNKKAQLRTQKLDNVQQALNYLENEEGITLVTIDSLHIVDGNLKLIMGLIWTLILHYSISISQTDSTTAHSQTKGQTPKQRLMQWIRSKLPTDVPVTNFTSDWNDGTALGALVDALAPGACEDWRSWRPDDALENTKKAMQAAEQTLGIGRLITPEELINPNVDEKSVMTFLSQFPRANAPPKGRISNVEPEPVVERETRFLVEVEREGMVPSVSIIGPDGSEMPTAIELLEGSNTQFQVLYVPEKIVVHGVQEPTRVKLGQFTVRAIPAPCLVDFKNRVEVGEEQRFRLANLTEKNQVELAVLNPQGDRVKLEPHSRVGGSITYSLTPEQVGLHSVNVFVDKRHIKGSPFPMHASPTAAAKALVWGRGLCSKGPRVGDQLPINIDGCDKPVTVEVKNKGEKRMVCWFRVNRLRIRPNARLFVYTPLGTGPHSVNVTCNGQHLGQSPYEVDVEAKSTWGIRAVGPGLEGGVCNQPAVFYVDTKGDANILEFSTEGPSQSEIQSVDNGDNTALVEYKPSKPGVYKVNVLNRGEHIKDSPFVIMIDPEKTTKSGSNARVMPANNDVDPRVGEKFEFFIESSKSPEVKIYDPDLNVVDNVRRTTDSSAHSNSGLPSQRVSFVPHKSGKYVISVAEDKIAIDETPFSIEVSKPLDLSKLHVYGPGVGANVYATQTTSFAVDARDVGCKKIDVEVLEPNGASVVADISQENNQPISVSYTPKRSGPHKVISIQAKIYVDGELAFDVNVDVSDYPTGRRSSRASASDSSERAYPPKHIGQTVAGQDASLHLKLKDVDPKQLTARMQAPDGRVESIPLTHAGGDHFTINFHPKQDGLHVIDVYHRGQPIEGSPFTVPVSLLGRSKAHLVRAEGTGLEFGQVGRKQSFMIFVGDAGGGELRASINGPAKADITLTDYRDGVCRAEYSTNEPGLYTISLLLDDAPISRSPFKVFIAPESNGSNVTNPPANKRPYMPESNRTSHSSHQNSKDETYSEITKDKRWDEKSNRHQQLDSAEKSSSFSYDSYSDEPIQLQSHEMIHESQENLPPHHNTSTYQSSEHQQQFNKQKSDIEKVEIEQLRTSAAHHDAGKRVVEVSGYEHETSSRTNKYTYNTLSADDVRRVTADGAGLYEFIPGQTATFRVNTSKAGSSLLFVGVVTSRGPSEEVSVKHRGSGQYDVTYKIPERTRALVLIKYGDREILGSPFTVRPTTSP
ncbi:Filamin-C [Aphelenchoides besseyi]|nr:Filamin-C [Aphelenchoides besseyi]